MADRFGGSFWVTGRLTREQFNKISKIADEIQDYSDAEYEDDIQGDFSECTPSDFEDLINAVCETDAWLQIQWLPKWEYEGHVEIYHQDKAWEFSADSSGRITVTLEELENAKNMTCDMYVKSLGIPDAPMDITIIEEVQS